MKTRGYITKWCLTAGIVSATGELADGRFWADGLHGYFREGEDFFESSDAAEANVRDRIIRRQKSLEKQLSKLDELYEVPKWAKGSKR